MSDSETLAGEPATHTSVLRRAEYVIPTITALFYTCFVGLIQLQPGGSVRYLPQLEWYGQLPFAFLAAWVVTYLLLWTFRQMEPEHRDALAIICSGGALGGFMLKFAILFLDETSRPSIPLDHIVCALLGLVCAGVSVYLITETDTAKKPKLFFLSVTAGLAFPSVLVTLLNPEAESVEKVEQQLERVAELQEKPEKPQNKKEIERIDGEVASTVAAITNSESLPLQEKVRRIEKIKPIAEAVFENSRQTRSISEISRAEQAFASQVAVIEQRIEPSASPSPTRTLRPRR